MFAHLNYLSTSLVIPSRSVANIRCCCKRRSGMPVSLIEPSSFHCYANRVFVRECIDEVYEVWERHSIELYAFSLYIQHCHSALVNVWVHCYNRFYFHLSLSLKCSQALLILLVSYGLFIKHLARMGERSAFLKKLGLSSPKC